MQTNLRLVQELHSLRESLSTSAAAAGESGSSHSAHQEATESGSGQGKAATCSTTPRRGSQRRRWDQDTVTVTPDPRHGRCFAGKN